MLRETILYAITLIITVNVLYCLKRALSAIMIIFTSSNLAIILLEAIKFQSSTFSKQNIFYRYCRV